MVALTPNWPLLALVRREFISLLRLRRSFVVVAGAMVLVVACVVVQAVETKGNQQSGDAARTLHAVFMAALLIVAGGAIPLLASLSISGERQRGTWEPLFMTHLRPWEFVAGKAAALLGLYALVLITLLPVMGVVFFQVGIGWVQFASGVFLATCLALLSVTVGLTCSAMRDNPATSAVLALVTLLVFHLSSSMCFLASPIAAALLNLYEPEPVALVISSVWSLGCTAFAFGLAREWVRSGTVAPDSWRTYDRPSALPPRVSSDPVDGLVQYVEQPIAPNRGLNNLAQIIAVGIVFAIIAIGGTIAAGTDVLRSGTGFARWLQAESFVLKLLLPLLVARSLVKEYEAGTFDMLRMTLITPRQLVVARLRETLPWVGICFLAVGWGVVVACLAFQDKPAVIVGVLLFHVGIIETAVVSLLLAQCGALLGRTTTFAFLGAFAAGVGMPLLAMIAWSYLASRWTPPSVVPLHLGPGLTVDVGWYLLFYGFWAGVGALAFFGSVQLVAKRHMRDR